MAFDYAAYRAEKFAKANPTLLKSLTEPLEKQLADKDSQIAERDAQIETLSAEIKRLREENAALKDEINTNRVQTEPAPKEKKAVRK